MKKLCYKDYNKQNTTCDNGNVQSHDKEDYYQQYVDIFVLLTSPQHLEAFRNFLNG